MQSRLLTVEELSTYLNLHPQTVYFMARQGELPVLRVGRAVRFDKVEIDLWIKRKIDEAHEKLLPWSNDRC